MTETTPKQPANPFSGKLAYAALLALFLAAAAGFTAYIEAVGINLDKDPIYPESGLKLASIPSKFPEYNPVWQDTGRRDPISKEIEAELGTSNHVTRYFELLQSPDPDDNQPPVVMQLHAAYYTGLIDTVPHVPERCFVGGGLELVSGSTRVVPIPLSLERFTTDPEFRDTDTTVYRARGVDIPNPVRLPKGVENLEFRVSEFAAGENTRVFAGYFFVANGSTVADAEQVRFQAFGLKEDYAYYMKVQFLSDRVSSAEELAQHVGSFLDEAFGELMLRCPDWIEVEKGTYPPDNPKNPANQTPSDA